MKTILIATFTVLILGVVFVYWFRHRGDCVRDAPRSTGLADQPFFEMRNRLLQGHASDFGIDTTSIVSGVWGCLMEMGAEGGSATVVSLADGTTSLYFSTGGGIIGGGGHEMVQLASKAFVAAAGNDSCFMTNTQQFPLPQEGRVRFYALTVSGVLSAEADENTLGERKHQLSSLFHAGQDVITQLRMATETPRL